MSVTCTEKVEGFIYVEAFKEIHVKEAIKGLSVVLGNKCMLVSKEEMPGIYQIEKQNINLEHYQWVRIKQGLYGGDLGLVEEISDNKVTLRLIPRLDLNKDQQKSTGIKEKSKNKFSNIRPPQRIFNPSQVPKALINPKTEKINGYDKDFIVYKKQLFRKGFIFKSFPLKQIQMDNVRPTIEEVQSFATYINKYQQEDDKHDNEITGDELIRKTFLQGNNSDINKGDKIRVIKGDLNGLYGTVITIENGDVLFKPNIEGLEDNLKLNADFVVKYFEPGDQVRIIDGKFKGETGIVVSIEGSFASIALTQNNREIKIFANSLKLKSEIDQGIMNGLFDKNKIS